MKTELSRLKERLARDIPALPMIRRTEIDRIDPVNWLRSRSEYPQFFWSSRDGSEQIACSGASLLLEANSRESTYSLLDLITGLLDRVDYPGFRAIFVSAFDPDTRGQRDWQGLPRTVAIVPEVTLVNDGSGKTTAYVSTAISEETPELEAFARLSELETGLQAEAGPEMRPLRRIIKSRADLPDRQGWMQVVESALEAIKNGAVEKVVPARETRIGLNTKVDPYNLLRLVQENSGYGCGFVVRLDSETAFVGCTPERLFLIRDGSLTTEALAGSASPNLEEEMLSSIKENEEHNYVVRFLESRLGPLSSGINVGKAPDVMRLGSISHLRTRIAATLCPEAGVGEVFRALHPTPAVCGQPRDDAMRLIRSLESFDRGWYSGPIGVVSRESAEFAVGIRSALLKSSEIVLYAGAGIVRGSVPESEWDELEIKIAPFISALGG